MKEKELLQVKTMNKCKSIPLAVLPYLYITKDDVFALWQENRGMQIYALLPTIEDQNHV